MGTTVKIGGEKFTLDDDDLEFSGSISNDMETIATLINNVGEKWAAAEEQAMNIDTAYREWRAKTGISLLEDDPKLAEWKVNQAIDAQPEFATYKNAIARAKYVALVLKNRFVALEKKAAALQSRGAMLRAELDSTNMNTPRRESVAAKKQKAKAILGG